MRRNSRPIASTARTRKTAMIFISTSLLPGAVMKIGRCCVAAGGSASVTSGYSHAPSDRDEEPIRLSPPRTVQIASRRSKTSTVHKKMKDWLLSWTQVDEPIYGADHAGTAHHVADCDRQEVVQQKGGPGQSLEVRCCPANR